MQNAHQHQQKQTAQICKSNTSIQRRSGKDFTQSGRIMRKSTGMTTVSETVALLRWAVEIVRRTFGQRDSLQKKITTVTA